MQITRRARQRLLVLLGITFGIGLVVVVGLYVRTVQKTNRAEASRLQGMAAAAKGDWPTALVNLSRAVTFDKNNVEVLMTFAKARSRVPEENNQHFRTAMNLYTRASDLARKQSAPTEVLEEALIGRARMERVNGALARLEDTSLELLEIDGTNLDAIRNLAQISRGRGNLLPAGSVGQSEIELVVCGERSDAEWLRAFRSVDDRSTLRWMLEQVVLVPDDFDVREEFLAVLREGRSVDLQLLRIGDAADVETTLDLVLKWQSELDPVNALAYVLMATELQRDGRRDECRESLVKAEEAGMNDPSLMLRAVALRENLGTPEDLAVAQNLLADAEAMAMGDADAAIRIGVRLWNKSDRISSRSVLDRAIESDRITGDDQMTLLATALVLASLDGSERVQALLDRIEKEIQSPEIAPELRESIRQILKFASISTVETVSEEQALEAFAIAATIPSNPLFQALLGDILSRANFQKQANDAWQRATKSANYRAVPLGQRAIRGLRRSQAIDLAFDEAVRLFSATRSLSALVSLCDVWLDLEDAGINAKDVVPRFEVWESPADLLATLDLEWESSGQTNPSLLPLMLRAALRVEDSNRIDEVIERVVDGGQLLDTPILLQVLNLMRAADLEQQEEVLELVKASESAEIYQRAILLTETEMLRKAGRPEEAIAILKRTVGESENVEIQLLLAFERIEQALASGGDPREYLEEVLSYNLECSQLSAAHGLAMRANNAGVSARFVDKAFEDFGERSSCYVTAFARHVLAFESTQSDSVRSALVLADPLISAAEGDFELQNTFVDLLLVTEPPQVSRAIDAVRTMVQQRPGRFDTQIRLIELLQGDGRFEESDVLIRKLSRRKENAPLRVQRLLPLLVMAQGNPEAMVESACELAQRTRFPADLLACAKACFANGEDGRGEEILISILSVPERSPEVDVILASRFASRGRVEEGITILRESEAFETELEQALALGGILLGVERWGELKQLLDIDYGSEAVPERQANLEILRALFHLGRPEPDPSLGLAALDRAVSLAPGSAAILNRNVTIRLQNIETLETTLPAIELLAELEPEQAELSRLLYDLEVARPGEDTDLAEFVLRAKDAVEASPRSRVAYMLAIDILGRAFNSAAIGADAAFISARYRELVELVELGVARFPGDQRIPIVLSNVYLLDGRFDDALAAVREGSRRAAGGVKIKNTLPVAKLESKLGRYADVVRTLTPFRGEIESSPADYPASWELLFTALLCTGDVEGAWDVFETGGDFSNESLQRWHSAIQKASSEIALVAAGKTRQLTEPGLQRLSLVGALLVVYRDSGDPRIRELVEDEIENIAKVKSAGPQVQLQAAILSLILNGGDDSVEGVREYVDIFKLFPSGFVADIARWRSLDNAEKERLAPFINPCVRVMNNAAAIAANLLLQDEIDDPGVQEQFLRLIAKLSDDLLIVAPENLQIADTRAMVAMASGDYETAVEIAGTVVRVAPLNADFRFTFARALRLIGREDESRAQAVQALRIMRGDPASEIEQVDRIEAFLGDIQG